MNPHRLIRHRKRDDRGFTLIELLVVITILGILSAVVVFAVRGSGEKGRESAVAIDERTIRTALEVYCAQKGQYPKAVTTPPPGKDPMQVLVDGEFLSSRSGYWALTTEGADVLEGNCPGVGPQRYRLDPIGTVATTTTSIVAQQPVCPTSVPNCAALGGIKALAGGQSHSLGLKEDGTVLAWGSNTAGELGGSIPGPRSLTPVPVISGMTAIASVSTVSLALKDDRTVWFWGNNSRGQAPMQVSGLSDVKAIAAGAGHYLALKLDGTVWAWGDNLWGQLGNGLSPVDSPVPTLVIGLSGVTAIGAGSSHSLAVTGDQTVWAWGLNQKGQLGNNTYENSSTPRQVSGLTGVTAIDGGGDYSIALKTGGTVRAWGDNGDGQLGDDTTINRPIPVEVVDSTPAIPVTAINAGFSTSLALKADGTVRAWGFNDAGQLGNGTAPTSPGCRCSSTPVPVSGLTGVTAVAGDQFSLALKGDKTARAWGRNTDGQLGDGTTTSRSTPVTVIISRT